MKNFILGIISLIVICFIASLVLEGTKFEKTAGKTLGVIITVSLCISCASMLFNIQSESQPSINLQPNENYIYEITKYKLTSAKNAITLELEKNNINKSEVYFTTSYENNELIIEKVHIDLTSAEYNTSKLNINTLQEYVINVLKIDKENIIVYL